MTREMMRARQEGLCSQNHILSLGMPTSWYRRYDMALAGAYRGVLYQKPSANNGIIQPAILFLAWIEGGEVMQIHSVYLEECLT